MQTRQAQRKTHILDRVTELLRSRLSAEQRESGEKFLRQFYANVGADDLAASTPDDMAGAVCGLWQFLGRRRPGETKIRVFHPRREEHGWHSPHTIIEIVNDDMPFLVDSVTADLNRQDIFVTLLIHPILRVRRDDRGDLVYLGEALPPDDGAPPEGAGRAATAESVIHIQIDAQPPASFEKLRQRLEAVLGDVRLAVGDWRKIVTELDDTIAQLESSPPPLDRDEIRRSREFLAWLRDNHFTFLGYRAYDLAVEGGAEYLRYRDGTGLGVLRHVSADAKLRHTTPLSPAAREFAHRREVLIIRKAYDRATVHRAAYMDYVGVRLFDASGALVGERRFLGLFTSTAYSERPVAIPVLREKIQAVCDQAGFAPAGHSAKALEHILETYPRDELFQASVAELSENAIGILQLQERQRIALFVRTDPFERFLSCLVYVPRDHYTFRLRQSFQRVLEHAFGNPCASSTTAVGDEPLARVHYVIATQPGTVPPFDIPDIESRLVEAAQSWSDRLRTALVAEHGEEQGLVLWRRYREAFSVSYTEHFGADWAVSDIEHIESVVRSGRIAIRLYRLQGAGADSIFLKLFHPGTKVSLSDIFPILVNLGVRVVSEEPFRVTPAGGAAAGDIAAGEIWIHDFHMLTLDGAGVDIGAVRARAEELLARVWTGDAEDDGFNRLVLRAGLDWREVAILRAYARYLRQTGIQFSEQYMQDTLDRNAPIARKLVELFAARFDFDHRRHAEIEQVRTDIGIVEALEAVDNLDEDRILRRFLNLVESTLRTNYYQRDADGATKPYIAFKLDSHKLDELPLPRPLYEIWVYSPRVEAVHLRGGKVARGGIRWSDRREDFRTEILGLMKAQMVKNAVIVPVGSKGGFIVKRPPAAGGREALLAEGIACYQVFMRGLLDLTDNIKGAAVQPPERVIRHDEDDPYLVVAADKGTATFSDIANAISVERGFWLGDAFASGGSAGYDHKKMGITARGAWESVKRHFREIGRDIGNEDFTVVGVGDMAGDVFGNGMLLSPHIRLVAAFNHLHVFIDPDPDAAASFAERKRLFELPRSAWTDYDRALISRGGGVFERRAKHIDLTPEMKQRFGLTGDRMTPADLIRALLRAEVDLLWFGGIGTFVKSSDESHAEAGDRVNDSLRIDAAELRCKVVGEGANLGFTQRGRIEYALAGGRLNTDAIDNSAGVDCSDHEVNIKIALAHVVGSGDMTLKQRDQLLVRMTDEVGELVLRDNYLQTQALSVEEARGADGLDAAQRFMRQLERAGKLNRAIEFLPDDDEIAARAAAGRGLTRPELAVVLAYAKIVLYEELLASDLMDDPLLAEDLLRYFPAPLVETHREAVLAHRLRREIVAASVTNSIVNRVGPSFVADLEERTGLPPVEIARAYAVARDVFDLRRSWHDIEALDTRVAAAVQTRMLLALGSLVQHGALWFLRHVARPVDISAATAEYGAGVAGLIAGLDSLLGGTEKAQFEARRRELLNQNVPEPLAVKVAGIGYLAAACDVVRIAAGSGYHPLAVGRLFFDIGDRFGLNRLRLAAGNITADSVWDKRAVAAVIDDLFGYQADIVTRILDLAGPPAKSGNGKMPEIAPEIVESWQAARRHEIERMQRLVAELTAVPKTDVAMLTVASRQMRTLIGA